MVDINIVRQPSSDGNAPVREVVLKHRFRNYSRQIVPEVETLSLICLNLDASLRRFAQIETFRERSVAQYVVTWTNCELLGAWLQERQQNLKR